MAKIRPLENMEKDVQRGDLILIHLKRGGKVAMYVSAIKQGFPPRKDKKEARICLTNLEPEKRYNNYFSYRMNLLRVSVYPQSGIINARASCPAPLKGNTEEPIKGYEVLKRSR